MTEIQYFNDLYADFERLAAEHEPVAPIARRSRFLLPRRRTVVGAALLCALAGISLFLVWNGARTETPSGIPHSAQPPTGLPRGGTSSLESSLPLAPLGSDPFVSGGSEVSLAQAVVQFATAAPAGTGALVVPSSAAAGQLTHAWIGPWPVEGTSAAEAVVLEYSSGIRVRVAPEGAADPRTPSGMRDAWKADVNDWGSQVATLTSVAGVPAELLHGDGSSIQFSGGNEVVDGTNVSLFLNGMFITVWADHTVSESSVISAAQSLAPDSSAG